MTARRAAGAPGTGPPKLIRGLGLKARLAGACAAVLATGTMLSPRTAREAAAPEEKAAPILQAEAERREPARVFRSIQETGRRVAAFSVAFPAPVAARAPSFADFVRPSTELRPQGGFGIIVSPDRVLTHVAALGGQAEPSLRFADGSAAGARVICYEAETGLVLLHVGASACGKRPRSPPPRHSPANWRSPRRATPAATWWPRSS